MTTAAHKKDPTIQLAPKLELPLEVVTERLAVMGQSGSGKTYAAMRIAELMLDVGAQIVAVDPVGPWWGLRAAADGKSAGYPVHVFGGIHGDVPITPKAGALVADVIVEKGISAVVDVSDFTVGEMHTFMVEFAERFFDRKKRSPTPVHVFFEEAHTFMPQQLPPDPKAALMLNRVERIVRVGRNHGIGSSLISQMPQSVNKKALNQAGTLLAMRTMGKNERKAIKEWMADKATDETQLDLDEQLKTLETGEAWVASPHWLKLFLKTRISRKTTFDSSATPKFGVKLEPPKILAAIDVEALREAMKETVAEAEKTDTTALQRRVRELETQLKKAQTSAPAPEKVEVSVLSDNDRGSLERGVETITTQFRMVGAMVEEMSKMFREINGKLAAKPPQVHQGGHHVTAGPAKPLPRMLRPAAAPATSSSSSLNKGEHTVLLAIAQHDAGVTREQLTVLTGYKRSSRDTYLQRLRAAGLVEFAGETITATSEGFAALGAGFQPLPTGDELREHWLSRLPEGERRILDALCKVYPDSMDRGALSGMTGYKRSSRDTYLQRLGARRLVESSGGDVKASPLLFN